MVGNPEERETQLSSKIMAMSKCRKLSNISKPFYIIYQMFSYVLVTSVFNCQTYPLL